MAKQTDDDIAEMVLMLVRELVKQATKKPTRLAPRHEPTGITYTREMAPWVEQRSDKRKAS